MVRYDEAAIIFQLGASQVRADDLAAITEVVEADGETRIDPDVEADELDPDSVFLQHDVELDVVREAGWIADEVLVSVGLDVDRLRDPDRMLDLLARFVPALQAHLAG